MPGIFAIFKKRELKDLSDDHIEEYAMNLKHRGPKNTFKLDKFPIKMFFHHNETEDENQLKNYFCNDYDNTFIAIDGHIYNLDDINHTILRSHYFPRSDIITLESLIAGYKKIKYDIFSNLIGTYSGILYDGSEVIGFKDPIGAKPLYFCNTNELFALSSELKALIPLKEVIKPIPPGSIATSSGVLKKFYFYPNFIKNYSTSRRKRRKIALKLNALVKIAVADNIHKGEDIGTLLSGGIDSTIITYIAKDLIKKLQVYTVGIEDSADLFYAKKFAEKYNLEHTIVKITLEDMLEILPKVIYALETYDAALIRSSVPLFIISQKIKSEGDVEVILTGEGGDELFGGYDYLKNFKSPVRFNNELVNLLEDEYKTGLQRVDRIPYFFSIEARAPLFDRRLVEFSFKIPPELKIFSKPGVNGFAEKWILRKAFEKEISEQFIWRKKQKFSEGAGSQFLLRDYIEKEISDEEFNFEKKQLPFLKLRSKEELYYWKIFNSHYKLTQESLAEIGITANYEL
ncbi:MAG: hypothetical protein EU532_08340 [Promethearchaeota archaeon]|nr:MAG: hypothetical protein EU532_08340 [Candidatus Lokiarchaeota archaeon]